MKKLWNSLKKKRYHGYHVPANVYWEHKHNDQSKILKLLRTSIKCPKIVRAFAHLKKAAAITNLEAEFCQKKCTLIGRYVMRFWPANSMISFRLSFSKRVQELKVNMNVNEVSRIQSSCDQRRELMDEKRYSSEWRCKQISIVQWYFPYCYAHCCIHYSKGNTLGIKNFVILSLRIKGVQPHCENRTYTFDGCYSSHFGTGIVGICFTVGSWYSCHWTYTSASCWTLGGTAVVQELISERMLCCPTYRGNSQEFHFTAK